MNKIEINIQLENEQFVIKDIKTDFPRNKLLIDLKNREWKNE